MHKKIFLSFTLCIVLIALGITIKLLIIEKSSREKQINFQNNPKIILQNVIQQLPLDRQATILSSEGVWKEQGYNVPMKGFRFIVISKNYPENLTPGPDFGIDRVQRNNLKDFEPLLQNARQYLLSHGFLLNNENTRLLYDLNHQPTDIYEGYQKKSLKCTLSSSLGGFIAIDMFCGEIDQEQITMQQSFQGLFDLKNGFMHVTKIDNDFAIGNYSQGSGYIWIAKKTGDKWQIIERFQSGIECMEIQKYHIPPSIYDEPNCH